MVTHIIFKKNNFSTYIYTVLKLCFNIYVYIKIIFKNSDRTLYIQDTGLKK
nr:MAG TPA: hypothetical protein [Caudoviricetes sp.]